MKNVEGDVFHSLLEVLLGCRFVRHQKTKRSVAE